MIVDVDDEVSQHRDTLNHGSRWWFCGFDYLVARINLFSFRKRKNDLILDNLRTNVIIFLKNQLMITSFHLEFKFGAQIR